MIDDMACVQSAIKKALKIENSWRGVARVYDLSPAILWRVVNQDYEPKRPDIRRKLGLPNRKRIMTDIELPENTHLPNTAKLIKCKNPDCEVIFIRIHPAQKYHDKKCRKK